MTTRSPSEEDEARLAELVDVVVAIASNDFSKRARVDDGASLVDGIAAGLNMLAEEVGRHAARERIYQERMLQQERLIAVGHLATGVAHEVNNPAAFVLMNLHSLDELVERASAMVAPGADESKLAEARALLQTARDVVRDNLSGVERIVAIVRDLRNFARLEPDRLEAVDVQAVVAEACSVVRAEVEYRARLVVATQPDVRVRADRTRLVQVFTNLLLNAAHAIAEGAPARNEVRIATTIRGARAIVTVADTGGGMTDEVARRSFEPFFTTKPRERGTGLGLAISADIVRHHGGALQLVHTSPTGTIFEVDLPLETGPIVAKASPPPASAPVPDAAAPARLTRVMLIDDEPMLLNAYRRFLGPGYDVTLIDGGKAAVAALETGSEWDAIICDLMMSDLDGAGVSEWMAAHRPELLERTLFCTGGAFTPRTEAFAAKIEGRLLDKPLTPTTLRDAIRRARASSKG